MLCRPTYIENMTIVDMFQHFIKFYLSKLYKQVFLSWNNWFYCHFCWNNSFIVFLDMTGVRTTWQNDWQKKLVNALQARRFFYARNFALKPFFAFSRDIFLGVKIKGFALCSESIIFKRPREQSGIVNRMFKTACQNHFSLVLSWHMKNKPY